MSRDTLFFIQVQSFFRAHLIDVSFQGCHWFLCGFQEVNAKNSNLLPHVIACRRHHAQRVKGEKPVEKATSFLAPPIRRSATEREWSGAALSEAGNNTNQYNLHCTLPEKRFSGL